MARVEIPEVVIDTEGEPVVGATVQVNVRDGGAATVYSGPTGSGTLSNPMSTNSYGRIEGWLEEGRYDLVVTQNGVDYTQRYEAQVGGSRTFVYNVVDYGAKGDGSADDTSEIQAAITACIAGGGGTVYLPAGDYRITACLDLSAAKNTRVQVCIQGAGGGEGTSAGTNLIATSTTRILNNSADTAIKAYGDLHSGVLQEIFGVQVKDIVIQNEIAIAGTDYTIDLDLVSGMVLIDNVYIYGGNFAGNGIRFANMAQGQSTFRNVKVRGFPSGEGFRIEAAASASVDVAFNSGNVTFISCLAMDVKYGWYTRNPSTLLNGCTFISCKAVNSSSLPTADIPGSIGVWMDGGQQHVWIGLHVERFETGIQLGSAGRISYASFIAAHVSYPTIAGGTTLPAGSCAVRIKGTCRGNHFQLLRIANTPTATDGWDYGVVIDDTAYGNQISLMDEPSAGVAISQFIDNTTAKSNQYIDLENSPLEHFWGNSKHHLRAGGSTTDVITLTVNGDAADNTRLKIRPDGIIWGDGTAIDTQLTRVAAEVLGLDNNCLELKEHSDFAAGAVNSARLYTRDQGGKTQLVVRFNTGAIQVIATEP